MKVWIRNQTGELFITYPWGNSDEYLCRFDERFEEIWLINVLEFHDRWLDGEWAYVGVL